MAVAIMGPEKMGLEIRGSLPLCNEMTLQVYFYCVSRRSREVHRRLVYAQDRVFGLG